MTKRTRPFLAWLDELLFGTKASLPMPPAEPKDACAFCGNTRDEVRDLLAGPTIYVCNECVELGKKLLAEDPDFRHLARPDAHS